MKAWTAEIGDKADFKLLDGERLFGDILHIPQATGDSWIINAYDEGKVIGIYFVQTFSHMRLVKNKALEEVEK